jgi:hypothetical protein
MEVSLPVQDERREPETDAGRRRRNPYEWALWAAAIVLLAVFLAGLQLILRPATSGGGESVCVSATNCPVPLDVVLAQVAYFAAPAALTSAVVCFAAALVVRAVRFDRAAAVAAPPAVAAVAVPRPDEARPEGDPAEVSGGLPQERPRDYTAYMRPASTERADATGG